MSAIANADYGSEILVRTIKPNDGSLSSEAARAMLDFRLSKDDTARVNDLATKARAGDLTAEERAELDDYERITALLEIMQSKARLSLKQAGQLP
jgi:hypothetical protein